MTRLKTLFVLLGVGLLILSGCAGRPDAPSDFGDSSDPAPDAPSADAPPPAPSSATQVSDAGSVVVEVTPLNLNGSAQETLRFQVALNTHSVDLSFDLAQLALLRTDRGNEVVGLEWDAPRGGHHVNGTLSFPGVDLGGVQWVEVVLRDVAGVPERVLHWDVEVAP